MHNTGHVSCSGTLRKTRSLLVIYRMKVGRSMQGQRSSLQITIYFLLYVCWQAHPGQSSPVYLDNVEDAPEYTYPEQLANPADELRRLRVFARELLQEIGMRRNTGIKRVSVDQTNAKKAYAQGDQESAHSFGFLRG
ncbi:hypothetical protein CRM22_010880 [Opisthorchis felineus]|uniref:Uncharacterized protein n=1 Tax=Opisthorchis felineus TaxID=147828 RepID=A0A4S2KKD7_OPIFE|nr:hypothetical protein CRM22_010880 [Opisthorchis felineus]